MGKIMLFTLLFFFPMAAQANTKPTDSVGVVNIVTKNHIEISNRSYFKPWGQLKLDQKTRTGLVAKAKALSDQREQYRVGFLFIINDWVSRALFYGNRGSVHMMDWPTGTQCELTFDGQSGFAGLHNKACHEPDEQ